jgi:glyoxylase-like metal-dependent hydrolase (beta-lactamase superfamily II)
MSRVTPFLDTDLRLGRAVALIGAEAGKYPAGNSLLVVGDDSSVLIDPSVSVFDRGGAPAAVDRMLLSHAHEDHMAGVGLYPDAPVHAHHDDLLGVRSLDGLMEMYGMSAAADAAFRTVVLEEFHFTERPDAVGFADGTTFDLGGGLRVEVVHLPGHTRGHCGFLVEPDGVFFVADVDLSSFGPYYGDHWSDLEDFEAAMTRCREIDARWYATFHHKGIVEGRDEFLAALDAFEGVIARREQRLLDFLAEPHALPDIVAHRLVYRPGVEVIWADEAETRTARRHLDRLLRDGRVQEPEPGRYRAA